MDKAALAELVRFLQSKLDLYVKITGLTDGEYVKRMHFTPHNVEFWRVRHLGRIDELRWILARIRQYSSPEEYEAKGEVIQAKVEEKYSHERDMWFCCEDCEILVQYHFIPGEEQKGCFEGHEEHVKVIGFVSDDEAAEYLGEIIREKRFGYRKGGEEDEGSNPGGDE